MRSNGVAAHSPSPLLDRADKTPQLVALVIANAGLQVMDKLLAK